MASWKEMAPYHGITSANVNITKPDGSNYLDSNGNPITHAPDDIIEGDTQFTAASVPLNKTEGMIDWVNTTLNITNSSVGDTWGTNMEINGLNAAEIESNPVHGMTFGPNGNVFSMPIRTKSSGNKIEVNTEWYNNIQSSTNTTASEAFVGNLSTVLDARLAGVDAGGVAGQYNAYNCPLGLYIAKRNGVPTLEVPYPTGDGVGFMQVGYFTGVDDLLVGGNTYNGFENDGDNRGFEYLRNHHHNKHTYVSGTGTSAQVKGHLTCHPSILNTGDTTALVVDNDQYIDALFTDSDSKVWIIYDLAKGTSAYGTSTAPATGSTFKTYMDANTGSHSITETFAWTNGLSDAVTSSGTNVPHISNTLTPVAYDTYSANAWLNNAENAFSGAEHTVFKVDGQDGSSADGTFTTIAAAETMDTNGYVFLIGRFLFVNITDLKASNSGIASGTSDATHATNMVWNITNVRAYKNVAHLGNLIVDDLRFHAQYQYELDAGSTDDLTLVSNQLNLINTTSGNVAGNGGLDDSSGGFLANRQSLKVPENSFAISLAPGSSSGYTINRLALNNTEETGDPDTESEIYFKWVHGAGAAGTPAANMPARECISWGFASPDNYIGSYNDVTPESSILSALGNFIDQESFGSAPVLSDVETFFGTNVMGSSSGDTANIDFAQWDLHMNNMPENCIFSLPGNMYKAPGTKTDHNISGHFSNNAKIFIRLADEDDTGYDVDAYDVSGN
jgi:hypothetical protein